MLVASDSESDLPMFPLLEPASRHDSISFINTYFSMRSFLPDFHPKKIILDSAHDAMPLYKYFKQEGITPFIGLEVFDSFVKWVTFDIASVYHEVVHGLPHA
jgi:hypothetical protein